MYYINMIDVDGPVYMYYINMIDVDGPVFILFCWSVFSLSLPQTSSFTRFELLYVYLQNQ
jgi:hypothetical protein